LPFSLALSDQLNGNEIEIAVTFGTQQSYKQTDKIKTMPNERAELGGTIKISLSSWLRIWIYHTHHICIRDGSGGEHNVGVFSYLSDCRLVRYT